MAKRKRKVNGKTVEELYTTIGIRYIHGARPGHVYTYTVPKNKVILLGQLLVVENDNGHQVVVVVRVDKGFVRPEDYVGTLKEIKMKVTAL
jgi:hypothetical protein